MPIVVPSRVFTARLRLPLSALLALACASCASFQDKPPDPAIAQRLEEVRSIAGPPVSSFRFMRMTTFEPIGLSNLMVFTAPQDAWLLQLDGRCRGLDFGPFMGLTSHMRLVMSGVDSVRVQDNPIPCRIVEIRRVDVKRLRRIDTEKAAPSQPDLEQPAPTASPRSG
ncbi:MAG: hypothetical protein JSR34_01555 [Proteobacteria bacterium]|nr:hypothetical protein [Pseudomonadota bacterium]